MCEACDNDDGSRPDGVEARLIPAARRIEAALEGERASEEAWAIFEGRAGGGMSWNDFQRLLSCYEAAEIADTGLTLGRRRDTGKSAFRCDSAFSAELA